jgi:hypothetical protein
MANSGTSEIRSTQASPVVVVVRIEGIEIGFVVGLEHLVPNVIVRLCIEQNDIMDGTITLRATWSV